MPHIDCFLCKDPLDQRTSEKAKPYFVCDRCGMQIFVRKKEGIERLLKLVTPSVDPQRASSPSLGRGNDRILEQIRQAETELKRLPSPTMAIMTGKDLDKLRTQRKALDSRLQRLRSELKNRE